MKIGQPKTIRIWEGKNCLGDMAYLEYRAYDSFHPYLFCDGINMRFISQTCLEGISTELRRFYGHKDH